MIGKTLAHYEIFDLLGKGGMGEVYRARDTRLDRDVALCWKRWAWRTDKPGNLRKPITMPSAPAKHFIPTNALHRNLEDWIT